MLSLALLGLALFAPFAQKSVTEFSPAQRAALQQFISKNPNYQFIPETWFDEETLKYAREQWGFGRGFKPYYQKGDFNRDGRLDFALILLAPRPTGGSNGEMHVIVFNGIHKGGFRIAHIEREEFSTALFIKFSERILRVGTMETDSIGCFVSAGNGYIVEPCQ